MKCLKQLCSLILLIGMTQLTFAQDLTITAPASIAGDYPAINAGFGVWAAGESAQLVLIDDGMGATVGCDASTVDLTGAIAVIDRGGCAFTTKVANAEAAGAIAVVVFNNDMANPDAAIIMGGDDGCLSTIPAIMLSYNAGVAIKAELANSVMGTFPTITQGVGEDISTAISLPGAGMYTADTITGNNPIAGIFADDDATAAKYYTITPAADAVMTVHSCLGGADTRLVVFAGQCRGAITFAGANDDFCEFEAGSQLYASSLDLLVTGGQQYFIYWDNQWDANGFDFEVSFGAVPMTNVVFTVDMSLEAAADVPSIAGTFNSWMPEPLTDNMDGTWSGTATILAGTAIEYKFYNAATAESGTELSACGVDPDMDLDYNRAYTMTIDSTQDLSTVCFTLCGICPSDIPVDCDNLNIQLEDNLDSYTVGSLGPQGDHWTTWSGTLGGAEDGNVVTTFANSGANSVEILGGGTQDVLLLLGDKTFGNYIVSWNMYVPDGLNAYYNIQHFEAPGEEWAMECFLNEDGIGTLDAGAADAAAFTYPYDEWFPVMHIVDIDNDWIDLYINGQHVYGWPFNWQGGATAGTNQLGAINFYPADAGVNYYVDDVYYAQLPLAADNNFYCHTATPITTGTTSAIPANCNGGPDQLAAPSATWYSYTADGDGYASLSSCGAGADTRLWIFSECGSRQMVGVNDDDCDLGTGDVWASYREWPVTTGETYYIAWDNRWDNVDFDFELAFTAGALPDGSFCQSATAVDFGTHTIDAWSNASVSGPVVADAGTGTAYSNSKWYSFTPTTDVMVRAYSCDVATTDTRLYAYTGDCTYFETLILAGTSDDDCALQSDFTWAATAGVTYYLEWDDLGSTNQPVHDWVLEEIAPVAVTFNVDMNFVLNAMPAFISIDGAAGVAMTEGTFGIFSYTADIFPGTTTEYLFQNGAGSSEVVPADCSNTAGNRFVDVGDMDMNVDQVCFETCESDCVSAVSETEFSSSLGLSPNPANDATTLNYNFSEVLDLNISVLNTVGQELYQVKLNGVQNGTHAIELNKFAPGIYLVQMTDGTNNFTKRLIVQ